MATEKLCLLWKYVEVGGGKEQCWYQLESK